MNKDEQARLEAGWIDWPGIQAERRKAALEEGEALAQWFAKRRLWRAIEDRDIRAAGIMEQKDAPADSSPPARDA